MIIGITGKMYLLDVFLVCLQSEGWSSVLESVKGYQGFKRLSTGSVRSSTILVRSSIGSSASLSTGSVALTETNEGKA